MTLQQIKYFLEVAKTQKFTLAAKNLFVAQSGLSYAIHELEHELGVPLFVRNANKKVTLTEYGEKYLPYSLFLASLSLFVVMQQVLMQCYYTLDFAGIIGYNYA